MPWRWSDARKPAGENRASIDGSAALGQSPTYVTSNGSPYTSLTEARRSDGRCRERDVPRLARAAASQRGQQRADTVARTGDHRIIRPISQPLETAPRHELVAPAWWDDDVEPRGAACMRQLRGRARPRRENRIVAEYDRGARHALGFRPPGSCCVHDTCAAGCDRCNLHGDTMERAGGGTCGAPNRSDKGTGRREAPRSFRCNRSVSPSKRNVVHRESEWRRIQLIDRGA